MFATEALKVAKHNLQVARTRLRATEANAIASKALVEMIAMQLREGPRILQEQQQLMQQALSELPQLVSIYDQFEAEVNRLQAVVASEVRPAGGPKTFSHRNPKLQSLD